MGQRIGGRTDHVTHCLARSFCVYWLDNYACQNILQSLPNSLLRLSPIIQLAVCNLQCDKKAYSSVGCI